MVSSSAKRGTAGGARRRSGEEAGEEAAKAKKQGLILLGIGVFFLLSVPILMFTDRPNKPKLAAGGLLTCLGFAIAGGLRYRRYRALTWRAQVLGFIESRDRFSVTEFARALGKTEIEAEPLLNALNDEERLGLMFDEESGDYVHRDRIAGEDDIPDKCPTCGAPVDRGVVTEHERPKCKFCSADLR